MSSTTSLGTLPKVGTITKQDILILEQTIGAQTTTHKITVDELLGAFVPIPTINTASYDTPTNTLTVKGANLFPTSLVLVDDVPKLVDTYTVTSVTNDFSVTNDLIQAQFTVVIPEGLAVGTHEIKIKNAFVTETIYTLTI